MNMRWVMVLMIFWYNERALDVVLALLHNYI